MGWQALGAPTFMPTGWGDVGVYGTGADVGVYGDCSQGNGVMGTSDAGAGVRGIASGDTRAGVVGLANGATSSGNGVHALSEGTGHALYARADGSGFAGYFQGFVTVTQNLSANNITLGGNVTKGGSCNFKIDHPIDPVNRYLYHSAVESPDMKNIYDGVVALDSEGEAVVELPAWFEALNQDFRYQLTAIGASGPNLYVAQEMRGGRFKIGGGQPGMKVSWQVTGIRHDVYAEAHRSPVEQDKTEAERGLYLHPELFGQPQELGIEWARRRGPLERASKAAQSAEPVNSPGADLPRAIQSAEF